MGVKSSLNRIIRNNAYIEENMKIQITDWSNIDQVLPLVFQYQVGIEVLEFANPDNLDQASTLLPEMLEKLGGISLIGMHGPFYELIPASRDPMVRQVARTRCQQGYEIAQIIGASHLVLHSGYLPKTYPSDIWIQNSFDFWSEFFSDKSTPNMIHVENVYEDDYAALRELIDRVNKKFQGDRLTICLDIGHVNANSSKSLSDWISGLGDRIRYVHLHNNDGVLDDHWRLDKGKIDVGQVLDLLQKQAPNAVCTVETYVEDLEPSLLWLKERGYL
jgi:sugar phosphate isomerase/epimerase